MKSMRVKEDVYDDLKLMKIIVGKTSYSQILKYLLSNINVDIITLLNEGVSYLKNHRKNNSSLDRAKKIIEVCKDNNENKDINMYKIQLFCEEYME